MSFCDYIVGFLESGRAGTAKRGPSAPNAPLFQGAGLRGQPSAGTDAHASTHPGEVVSCYRCSFRTTPFNICSFGAPPGWPAMSAARSCAAGWSGSFPLLPKPEHHYRAPSPAALPAQYQPTGPAFLKIGNPSSQAGPRAVLQDQGSLRLRLLQHRADLRNFWSGCSSALPGGYTDWSSRPSAPRRSAIRRAPAPCCLPADNTLTIQDGHSPDRRQVSVISPDMALRQPPDLGLARMLASLDCPRLRPGSLVVPSEGTLAERAASSDLDHGVRGNHLADDCCAGTSPI